MFSDIEGSTRMLRDLGGDAYGALQDEQAALIREELGRRGGVEVRTEGDSFFAVFPSAVDALTAAVAIQRSLSERATRNGERIRLRIGLHTGEGKTGGDDYLGLDVNKAARVAASANGGQIVL